MISKKIYTMIYIQSIYSHLLHKSIKKNGSARCSVKFSLTYFCMSLTLTRYRYGSKIEKSKKKKRNLPKKSLQKVPMKSVLPF